MGTEIETNPPFFLHRSRIVRRREMSEPPFAVRADPGHTHVPVHFRARTRRSVIIFAIVAALGLLAVFILIQHSHRTDDTSLEDDVRHAKSAAIPVDAIHVHRGEGAKLLVLPGDARSFYETTIFARTNGYVSKWCVDIGDRVKEGETLATIETPELDDQLHEARAKLGQMDAEANVAAASAKFAKVSFDRWEVAATDHVVSDQERDQKKAELDTSLAKLEAAKSEVKLGQAQVQQLETLEKFKNVCAPFEGVITQRHIDIGALVTAGSTTNTSPLYTLSQSKQIRVFVEVPQPAVPDINVGMEAIAEARELPGKKFRGIVDRTGSSLDPHSRTLKVEVLVPNPKLTLRPGMYLQVTFQTDRADPPLRIPPAALSFGPHGAQVVVVRADASITFRPITIGRDLGDSVEVESGLKDGDVVALNVGSQASEGEHVEAHFIDPAAQPSTAAVKTAAHHPAAKADVPR